ncbi:MAG: carboxypeptidase regulatory-like domain-containing protein [Planctomycetes bacterium]|nr:carboxypeptidase regulatory-like domain-containing protein [Planctomycetota bacterium]MBL7037730.1 carboxypeptidase regulatory-like domain-containing protein [Pirellulaceae bacterium]
MRVLRVLRGGLVVLASFGMLAPQVAFGAGPGQGGQTLMPAQVRDVALQENGLLNGQVLDTQAAPVAGAPVVVGQQGKVIAETRTDATGRFAVAGLKGGIYQVVTVEGGAVYRAWAPHTAPPAVQSDALIVSGDTVTRGAMNGGALGFLANPWVLGGIVVAAVAIPLALDDDDAS